MGKSDFVDVVITMEMYNFIVKYLELFPDKKSVLKVNKMVKDRQAYIKTTKDFATYLWKNFHAEMVIMGAVK